MKDNISVAINIQLLFNLGAISLFRMVFILSIIAVTIPMLSRYGVRNGIAGKLIYYCSISAYAIYLFHNSYFLLINLGLVNIRNYLLFNLLVILQIPILFSICYFVQTTADRLVSKLVGKHTQ